MASGDTRITITDELVTSLVEEQFPDLAALDVGRHYRLADHTVVRLGDEYGLHLPTVPGLDAYYERSARLVAPFLKKWTFPYAAPLRTGTPSAGYPYHFELTGWITASTAG